VDVTVQQSSHNPKKAEYCHVPGLLRTMDQEENKNSTRGQAENVQASGRGCSSRRRSCGVAYQRRTHRDLSPQKQINTAGSRSLQQGNNIDTDKPTPPHKKERGTRIIRGMGEQLKRKRKISKKEKNNTRR